MPFIIFYKRFWFLQGQWELIRTLASIQALNTGGEGIELFPFPSAPWQEKKKKKKRIYTVCVLCVWVGVGRLYFILSQYNFVDHVQNIPSLIRLH